MSPDPPALVGGGLGFGDPNLFSTAGLVPAMVLAESTGLHDLLEGVPAVIAGADTGQGVAIVDVDDTIREVHR